MGSLFRSLSNFKVGALDAACVTGSAAGDRFCCQQSNRLSGREPSPPGQRRQRDGLGSAGHIQNFGSGLQKEKVQAAVINQLKEESMKTFRSRVSMGALVIVSFVGVANAGQIIVFEQ